MAVNRTLNASLMTGAASRSTATCTPAEGVPFLAGITCLGSVSKCNFSSICCQSRSHLSQRLLIDTVQVLRPIPRAKDAVLRLKLVDITSVSEDSVEQSNCSSARRAILLRHLNHTEVTDLELGNSMTFLVFIGC